MERTDIETIRKLALELHEKTSSWHFHCMTPSCILNTNDSHAFVLEDVDQDNVYVNFSEDGHKALAKELSPLLHGSDVMNSESTSKEYAPSEIVLNMQRKAIELNDSKVRWHHHMLFPNCVFNGYTPQHVLMLEDSITGEAIISLTEHDPIDDLKQIEKLYFVNT